MLNMNKTAKLNILMDVPFFHGTRNQNEMSVKKAHFCDSQSALLIWNRSDLSSQNDTHLVPQIAAAESLKKSWTGKIMIDLGAILVDMKN